MKVESKYKNPDLYVAMLKKRLAEARQRERDSHLSYVQECNQTARRVKREVAAVWGEQVNTWVDGITKEQEGADLSLGVFDPGDIVIFVGRVIEVRKHKDKSSSIQYDLMETRRRDHD